MDPQQSLQLHDIHIPGDPSIWPLAIGWWILIAITLLLLIYLFKKIRRQLKIKNQKKILREEYSQLEKKLENSPDKNSIAEANILLRRFALAYYPGNNIASLTGNDWLSFLDQSGNTQEFSRGAGRILIDAPYRSGQLENYNGEEFVPLIRNWVYKTLQKVGGCL